MKVDGKVYLQHRLAWLYVTGEWPEHSIDHIDGNPGNNRFANLRDVPQNVNAQNRRKAQASKKYSTLLGAQWCKQVSKWKTSVRVNGRMKHIGFFASAEDAAQAYVQAKRVYHLEGNTL